MEDDPVDCALGRAQTPGNLGADFNRGASVTSLDALGGLVMLQWLCRAQVRFRARRQGLEGKGLILGNSSKRPYPRTWPAPSTDGFFLAVRPAKRGEEGG